MASVLIVFGSTTGNTESIAHILERKLTDAGHTVSVQNAANAKPEHIAKDYNAVLFGASAWGEEDIEMQEDFDSFFEHAKDMDLANKPCAAFASGDRSYPHFCGAVDVIEETVKQLGGNCITDGLRIEGDGQGEDEAINTFIDEILKVL
ncbi:MAG: flavodoxin [Desulfovibrio sp.]|nr:flavodoxin [Desulfovibrio sp.]